MLAVKHLPLDIVPQFIKRGDDGFESASVIMRKESLDVFKRNWRGRLARRILARSKKSAPRASANPRRFPATEKAWHGNPATRSSKFGSERASICVMSPYE